MKVPSEVKESLEQIPKVMLSLANQAVEFAANMQRAATCISEEIAEMETEDE